MFDMRSRKKKILLQLILLLMTIPYAVPLVQMVLDSLGGIGLGNYKAVWDTGVVPVFFAIPPLFPPALSCWSISSA